MPSVVNPARGPQAAATAALQQHWGYAAFRPGQWPVIEAALQGRDALAILPTGGGKSLCYQVPAVLLGGLTLVVSPLIALMQDQVAALAARGIPACALTSALGPRDVEQAWTDAEFGRYRLLYVAPERLQSDTFRARAARLPIRLLAIDEAHCISEWGHDFRPAYRRIAEARALLPEVPVLAVTATATPEVRRDIIAQLGLRQPHLEVQGFDRPNLLWSLYRTEDKAAKVREIVQKVGGSGLVYAATRSGTERWARLLERDGLRAEPYHAGLPTDLRAQVQARWLDGETRIVVATSAFGMGIDKPDVRFVVHVELPHSLEAYYQEAGRAGRDGERAHAVLLYQPGDEAASRAMADEGHPTGAALLAVYRAACNLAQIAVGSLPDGPFMLDPDLLARTAEVTSTVARAAVQRLAREGVWDLLPDRAHIATLRMRQPADALRRYAEALENRRLAAFVRAILRTIPAEAFRDWVEVDLRPLEQRTRLDRDRLLRGFQYLAQQDWLTLLAPGSGLRLLLHAPRSQSLVLDYTALDHTRRIALGRVEDLVRYARSVTCRRQHLLAYFGQAHPDTCGTCDVCLGRHRPAVLTPADEPLLRHLLAQIARGDDRADWLAEAALPAFRVDGFLDWLVHEGHLRLEDPLQQRFTLTPRGQRFVAPPPP